MNLFLLLFPVILLIACTHQEEKSNRSRCWQQIRCRDEGDPNQRMAIYRARIPLIWERRDPPATQSIADTMKPITEFWIKDQDETLRITLHTFPCGKEGERIAPAAQLYRWRRQFDLLDPANSRDLPIARGGFTGLYFEATGIIDEKAIAVLGWSMQLATEHYRSLLAGESSFYTRQCAADYTIKAVGSPQLLMRHKEEIMAFANSFELIEAIALQ